MKASISSSLKEKEIIVLSSDSEDDFQPKKIEITEVTTTKRKVVVDLEENKENIENTISKIAKITPTKSAGQPNILQVFRDLSANAKSKTITPSKVTIKESKEEMLNVYAETFDTSDSPDQNASSNISNNEERIPQYYLRNFFIVLDSVLEQHTHLFLPDELELLRKFKEDLSEAQQRLYIRLYQRKGPWFKISTLNYREIPNIEEECRVLETHGFASTIKDANFTNVESLLDLINVNDLKNVIKAGNWKVNSSPNVKTPFSPTSKTAKSPNNSNVNNNNRDSIVKCILLHKNQKTLDGTLLLPKLLWKALGAKPIVFLTPTSISVFDRVRRLFFMDDHSQHNLLLLVDMGKIQYPKYNQRRDNKVFESRQDLIMYEQALQLQRQFDEFAGSEDITTALQILNSASKWLLHTHDETRDPFLSISKREHSLSSSSSAAPKSTLVDDFTKSVTDFYPLACSTPMNPMASPVTPLECFSVQKTPQEIAELVEKKPFLARFSVGWVFARLVSHGIPLLEKNKMYQEAVLHLRVLLSTRFCPGRRGKWWDRLALDVDHLSRKNDSLTLAEEAVLDPLVRSGPRQSLQRRVMRLAKPPRRWKTPIFPDATLREAKEITIYGDMLTSNSGWKSKFRGVVGGHVTVEEYALDYYSRQEKWQGVHSENEMFRNLFGMFMWDVLFADVTDVFQTAFQDAPLDLYTDAFYSTRAVMIEERLNEIRGSTSQELVGMLEQAFVDHLGTSCTGVYWDRHDLKTLSEIVACVGGQGLAGIFKLFAEDYHGWAAGFPDLLLWNPTEGKAKISEVKGPRDRLSDKQRAWIDQLLSIGLEVEICHVHERDP